MSAPEKPLLQEPSDAFDRAVCDAGTPRATCGFCGCEHIASEGYLEEGELSRFRLMAKGDPKGCVEHACMSLSIGELDGVVYVAGCACHRGRKYEDFIWQNRRWIIDYIRSRTEDAAKQAAATAAQLARL
jgi:hypothetical protein